MITAGIDRSYRLPALGHNPSTDAQGTTPGSFALPPVIRPGVDGARTFASPDTPGMPGVSDKTAWDFLPDGWETSEHRTTAAHGVQPVGFRPGAHDVV
ncbi:MAG TPA: hypothetical protein VM165_11420, partial [Planctomycetaceae bacterium]|nr:hypothetical protein [Planctomycetaceae bacterium]